VGEHRDFKGCMTLERDLRHTVTGRSLVRILRTPKEPRGAIAGWLSGFWEFLCGR
jgi:hypothetical protein